METVRRISGSFTLETINGGSITFKSQDVIIDGDLTVLGNSTSVESTDLEITDRIIVLNKGESGTGVTSTFSGIEVDRGSLPNTQFIFDEVSDSWVVSTDGGATFRYVLTSASGSGSGLENVVEDISPQLGGDLDVNSQSIVSTSNGDIVLAPNGSGTVVIEDSELALKLQASDPSTKSGYNLLYHKTEDSGGTGLYFKTSSTNDELVSKTKAIVFSIIF
jgi:hypothetical protein